MLSKIAMHCIFNCLFISWHKGYYWFRNALKNKFSSYLYDTRIYKIDDILDTTESLVSFSIRY
ncbi:Uncharacterised protein [Photobacterium damselae]|nr:Uncharacterised protein [Photobacterium damselae]